MIIGFIKEFVKQKLGFKGRRALSGRQGKSMTLLVREVGELAIAEARAIGANRLLYEYGELNHPIEIECKRKTISDTPNKFFQWNEKVVELAGKYVRGMFKANCGSGLNRDLEAFKKYLHSFFQVKLSDDVRLLCLIDGESDVVLSVDHPFVISKLHDGRVIGGVVASLRHFLLIIRNCMYAILFLLRGINSFWKKKIEAKHLLIPYHQNVGSNPEFFLLYNSIDDPIVIANKHGELFKHLSQAGAKVISESDLYVTPRQFLSSLKLSISMFFKIQRSHWSLFLILAISDYMKRSAKIHAYYNLVSVKHIGIVRGDMCYESSLLRNISASVGVTTYAYTHSVWWYREWCFCSIDYDWFGLSSENELKNIAEDFIDKSTKFINVGQLTYAYRNGDKENCWKTVDQHCSHTICIYPSSICEYELPYGESAFKDFIDAVCTFCQNENVSVYYKSKQSLKAKRGDPVDSFQVKLDCVSTSKLKEGLGGRFQVLDENVTAYDTFDNIDIGFVFTMTIVAFELLQNKKKVLVYWPSKTNSHPFGLHTPLLVAQSKNDFIEKAMILKNMPNLEYEKYILPTLQYHLGGSDVLSVESFIEQIENSSSDSP